MPTDAPERSLVPLSGDVSEAGTFTRLELEELRGGLSNGNGAGDLAVPLPRPAPARVCALPECDAVLAGRPEQQYCTPAHQRRASERRRQAREQEAGAEEAGELLAGMGLVENKGAFGPPTAPRLPALDVAAVACLAAALPAGWRLELAAGSACFRWPS